MFETIDNAKKSKRRGSKLILVIIHMIFLPIFLMYLYRRNEGESMDEWTDKDNGVYIFSFFIWAIYAALLFTVFIK